MSPVRSVDLQIDVTEAAGLGEPAHIALTVTAPDDAAAADPVVCFAKPGAGYSRGYYTEDLPGPGPGAQAAWHARARLGLRLRRPPRRGRQLAARSRTADVRAGHRGQSGRRGRGAAEAGGGHPDRRARPRARLPSRSASGSRWAAPSPSCSRAGTTATTASPCSATARCGRSRPTGPGQPPLPLPWVPRDTQLSDGVFTNGPALAELPNADAGRLRRPARRCRWPGASTTTTSIRRWCGATWRTTRPGTATSRRGDRPPSRPPRCCGAWRRAPPWPRRRPSAAPFSSRWASATSSSTRAASRGPTSRRPASTSSSARAWRTCTTSPGRASCSGAASRRGPSGSARSGTPVGPPALRAV